MAELTRRATTLIKEMLTADGKLPVYNVWGQAGWENSTRPCSGWCLRWQGCCLPGCLRRLLQEEVVRQVVQQVESHQNSMTQVIRSVSLFWQG